jgi:hypothetical protein
MSVEMPSGPDRERRPAHRAPGDLACGPRSGRSAATRPERCQEARPSLRHGFLHRRRALPDRRHHVAAPAAELHRLRRLEPRRPQSGVHRGRRRGMDLRGSLSSGAVEHWRCSRARASPGSPTRRDGGTAAKQCAIPGPERSAGLLEEVEEPSRSTHVCSQGRRALPQCAIRRHERDHLLRAVRGDRNERVITAANGVDDGDAIGEAARDTLACLAFQDHHDGLVEASRVDGSSHPVHERPGRSGPVPPPAGRTRPDHVGSIDQEHRPSVLVTEVQRASARRRSRNNYTPFADFDLETWTGSVIVKRGSP